LLTIAAGSLFLNAIMMDLVLKIFFNA